MGHQPLRILLLPQLLYLPFVVLRNGYQIGMEGVGAHSLKRIVMPCCLPEGDVIGMRMSVGRSNRVYCKEWTVYRILNVAVNAVDQIPVNVDKYVNVHNWFKHLTFFISDYFRFFSFCVRY